MKVKIYSCAKKYAAKYILERYNELPIENNVLRFIICIPSILLRSIRWAYNNAFCKDKVVIESYDLWNADVTMATIFYPMLLKLKESKCSAPFVWDEDVPPKLRSINEDAANNGTTDYAHFFKWEYVLEHIIFSFHAIKEGAWNHSDLEKIGIEFIKIPDVRAIYEKYPNDTHMSLAEMEETYGKEEMAQYFERLTILDVDAVIQEGLLLFGKYYRSLWV